MPRAQTFTICIKVPDWLMPQLDANDSNGKIAYSTNNGATWMTLHSFNHPVFWLAINPNDPNTMYASVVHFGGTQGSQSGGIYKTSNLNSLTSSVWTKLPNPPRTEGHPASIEVLNDGKVVCTFSGRRNSSNAFTASSGVFIFDPSLNSWTDVSNSGMYYWTKDLIIDPNDVSQKTWYVCVFSGWGGAPNGLGGLYKTINRGLTWTKLTGSQFDRVTSITFNPQNLKQAYLTTETQGLWISNDMNNSVPTWSLVSSYPFRQPERVFFNPYNQNELWVTSFGNGIKMGNIISTGISDFQTPGFEFILYPNPAKDRINFKFQGSSFSKNLTLILINTVGEREMEVAVNSPATSFPISRLRAGIHFYQLKAGKEILKSGKIIVTDR